MREIIEHTPRRYKHLGVLDKNLYRRLIAMDQVYHSPDIPTSKVCTKCHIEKMLDDFTVTSWNGRRAARCKKCENAWKSQHAKDTYDYDVARDRNMQQNYGITLAEYNIMLEAQGGVCAICKQPPKSSTVGRGKIARARLVVDHCHTTNAVRGLLCSRCNAALGYLREDPDLARQIATYIEERCLW